MPVVDLDAADADGNRVPDPKVVKFDPTSSDYVCRRRSRS
jgi:hypothetical protein